MNSLIGKAVYALCSGSQEAYRGRVQQLANERAPGWMQAVSRSLVEVLRLSVTAAWRHAGSRPSWPGMSAGSFPTPMRRWPRT